tara:strand:+ start:26 stop:541 length:516 start_codon:yes stop_codon:yes gene_type:complete
MKTYTIYYGIRPNGNPKIGVDEHYPNRAKVQKLTNYYAMEEHTCIDTVDQREIELQIQHFGKRDNSNLYSESVALLEKHRVTWNSETARAAALLVDNAKRGRFTAKINKELGSRPKIKARALTPEQVKEIRDVYVPYKYPSKADLALQYGVSHSSINKVNNHYPPYDYKTP